MRKKHLGLAASSALFLSLGLHPLPWTGISWLGFLPLFLLSLDPSCKTLLLGIYAYGSALVYFGIVLYGVTLFQWPLYLLLTGLAALLFPLYFLSFRFLSRRAGNRPLLHLGLAVWLWILLEKICERTPLGGIPAQALFYGPLEFLQIAALGSFSGLSAMIAGFNLSLAQGIRFRRLSDAIRIAVFLLALTAMFLWGHHRLSGAGNTKLPLHAALIQHNLPISGEWRLNHPDDVTSAYQKLAREAAQRHPDLIVFPLYSLPDDPLRNPDFFSNLSKEAGIPILLASHIPKSPHGSIMKEGYMNMAILFSGTGEIIGQYQNVQSAPSFFTGLREWRADQYQVMKTPLGNLGILLCYEDTNPLLAKEAVKQGAGILIALSNPGHFTSTSLPHYHLLQDQLRAIETGLPVLRVSANGYSAVIDPRGRILRQSRLNRREILT